MAITTFDTLKFVRHLQQAGVPVEQAEVQAEVLAEAFNVNLESLVTKEYLQARFAEHGASMEVRFAKVDARLSVITWVLAANTVAVFIPLLERLMPV